MKDIDTKALMGEAKFYEAYSRWNDEFGRYETWDESVSRVMNMHRDFYKDKMSDDLALLIDEAEALYKLQYVLGAQRALQFGGDQILKHQMRMYNCGGQETTFVTTEGLKSFKDYNDGDVVTVKTPQGNWKSAIVRSYGEQQLNAITLKRNNGKEKTVRFTADHRWLLKNGEVTTSLKEGDRLYHTRNTFNDFNFDDAEPDEKLYWAYGYVYGDGTINKTHSMVRLCGKDVGYAYRFEELGFKTSSSLSLDGDIIAYTGKYKKTLPDTKQDSPRLIRAFVRGFLDADGEKAESRFDHSQFTGIQSSNPEAIEFIRNAFPIAGIYPSSEIDKTGEITNYGERPYAVRFSFSTTTDSKYAASWRVESIKKDNVETVWCLEVEDDHAFVMEAGIPTGNCTSSYADRPAFFGELFYVLLCGAGAGFSVQTHHVAKLPKIAQRKGQAKIHEVEDSIEGWAMALDVLMSSYFIGGKHPEFEGRRVYFDLNKIRPKGAMISGGFKAPGPEPLRKSLDKIEHILQGLVLAGQDRLRAIHVYDICMHAADAVLAGGVRRSATICLFSPDDEEMMNAKTGNWFMENPQRGRSNNSAVIVRKDADRELFAKIMKSVKEFGEPGFVFTESTEHTYNPCVSADTLVLTDKGRLPVRDLINVPFNAVVNGKSYTTNGFWKTGTKPLYLLTTKDGYSVRATSNHKILTSEGWKELGNITTDDYVMLNENDQNVVFDDRDYDCGWLIGSFHGDGTVTGKSVRLNYWNDEIENSAKFAQQKLTEHFFTTKPFNAEIKENYDGKNSVLSYESKSLHKFAESIGAILEGRKANLDRLEELSESFKLGYIAGMIDSDGSWQGSIQDGLSLRVWQKSLRRLEQMQRMLIDVGIKSKIYKNRNKSRMDSENFLPGTVNRVQNEMHEISISGSSLFELLRIIRLQNQKYLGLYNEIEKYTKGPYKTKFHSKVSSIKLDGFEDVYDVTVDEVHRFDANGIIVHNCVEIGKYPVLIEKCGKKEEKISGWQGCNLSEINGGKCTSEEEFLKACRVGAILGTLQAGYTDFKFLDPISKKIFDREALIGVSVTGWMNSPDVLFDEKILKKGAELIKKVNRQVAKLIGINPAARTTCVKPSGNASVLLGTSSGIHGDHSPRYLRHVQMNKEQEVAQLIKDANPYMVEESVWSTNGSDYQIAFPVIAPKGSIFKRDLYGNNLLEKVKLVQNSWVEFGTDESLCVDPTVRHNVSNTVQVAPGQWEEIEEYLFENRDSFAGISFISASGDKDYNQAPFTEVLTEDQLVDKYGRAAFFASGLIVESSKGFGDLWTATFTAQQDEEDRPHGEQKDLGADWIRRFNKFAANYFDGDEKAAEYCLKDVYLLHKWTKIQQNMTYIDFKNGLAEKTYTDIDTMGAVACAGGACEI